MLQKAKVRKNIGLRGVNRNKSFFPRRVLLLAALAKSRRSCRLLRFADIPARDKKNQQDLRDLCPQGKEAEKTGLWETFFAYVR